ncbi:hypothetical protein MUK42_35355 [Musa troglodytarum]|uniref:Uncharacterized protein n=1 Tax=Musa troglodytarum TaxID=320322 RepID=A0A9E7EHL8_9LILI|nr:hypothetical protein MUK42_35355 [Musa troglodytarum]
MCFPHDLAMSETQVFNAVVVRHTFGGGLVPAKTAARHAAPATSLNKRRESEEAAGKSMALNLLLVFRDSYRTRKHCLNCQEVRSLPLDEHKLFATMRHSVKSERNDGRNRKEDLLGEGVTIQNSGGAFSGTLSSTPASSKTLGSRTMASLVSQQQTRVFRQHRMIRSRVLSAAKGDGSF